MFPQANESLKVTTQLYYKKHGAGKILSGLVSEHYGDFSLTLHNSTNLQLIFTNEVFSFQQDIIC